jgi:hypothetical protein
MISRRSPYDGPGAGWNTVTTTGVDAVGYRVALLFSVILVPGALAQSRPAPIPVIKTWEDLQAQPAIDLGDGVTIRLGLEADKIPQWSGGLLYCLAEGYTPPSSGEGQTPLGPVHANFTFEKGKKERSAKEVWASNSKSPKGTYLYVRALPVDRVGTYHATVTNRDGKVLAAAVVEGTRDFFHPWMPWLNGFEHHVAPWEAGIALPRLESFAPAIFLEPGKTNKGSLPTFLPDDAKPALTIKKEGKALVIRADTNFTTSRPERHFLARWWVNGKPFVPKQTDRLWIFEGYGLVHEDKELRVEFDFRPERLGARPGDKVGLQLMHSEGGWDWCAEKFLAQAQALDKRGENIRVSNRIEFEVPK